MGNKNDYAPKNGEIRSEKLRVVDDDGTQLGIIPTSEALRIAREKNLDLVMVASQANPPVAKIMNFGKYKYEKEKRQREAKKKSKQNQLKEMKFRIRIDTHDYETKCNRIRTFLDKGSKVRVVIMFRGREIVFADKGKEILDRVASDLSEISEVDRKPKLEGRDMWMILRPVSKKDKPKQGGNTDEQKQNEDS